MTATIKLIGPAQVNRACEVIRNAPLGHVVTVREPTRNLDQNAKMHAMIDDVASVDPLGYGYDQHDYKAVFVHAWKGEAKALYGLDGRPFPAPIRSSTMTVRQMADLIELISAYGAEHGVVWSEPKGNQS